MTSDPLDNSYNPYAVSEASSGQPAAGWDSGMLQVEGHLLKVGSKVHLPEICIVTGETDDLVSITKKLSYVSPVILVAFVLSPLIGLILYAIMRKQVAVTYSISRFARSQNRWLTFYGFLFLVATVATVFGIILSDAAESMPWLFVIPVVMFVAGLVFMVMGSNQLTAKKYKKPNTFWLKGAMQPFLDAIASNPDHAKQSGF